MSREKKRYFAASNTERGFVSFFEENFRGSRSTLCYIIKGGPGTGKSRLLGELGKAAEQCGGEVEYYYCSSDPNSLDGIFVTLGEERISVIDGTAPHAEDLRSPGVVDNIIDLGRFWDRSVLQSSRIEIERLNTGKSSAYRGGYRCLAAAGSLTRAADALVEECADIAAIREEAAKIAIHLPLSAPLCSPLSAIGMRGWKRFDTFRESSEFVLTVSDCRGYGISYLYFDALRQACGGNCRTASAAIFPDRCEGIASGGIAIVPAETVDGNERSVDVSEFVDREAYLGVCERVEKLRELSRGALAEAERYFAIAGEYHLKIEDIFISAMDFDAKEEYSAKLCAELF